MIFTWNTSGDWEAMVASAAAAVGRASQEQKLESSYRQRADGIKTTHADVLATARFDLVTAGEASKAYVWLPGSGVAIVLTDAGVQLASASQGSGVKASKE